MIMMYTFHSPTARRAAEQKSQGYRRGADAYAER